MARGGNVSLSCDATGVPQPQLSWLVNGLPLRPSPRVRVHSAGRALHISDARDEDAATYTCAAVNIAGVARHDTRLDVFSVPRIAGGGDEVEGHDVDVGQPFALECSVQGLPRPTVEWLKDGVLLASTAAGGTQPSPSSGYEMSADGRRLTVTSTQLRHAGDYTCQAVNKAGSSNKKYNVNVRGNFSQQSFYKTTN